MKWPVLSRVSNIRIIEESEIEVTRSIPEGRQKVVAKLPTVVTINKDYAEPRFPSLMGKRKASKAVIPIWTIEELNININQIRKHETKYEVIAPQSFNFEMINGENPQDQVNQLIEKLN